ncbi:MAG: hypothetical protein EOM25_07880 [Deltaproteobacteria bacterium]|nr:hypothetical protein [Deltaproteobacteria bacterium]
MPSAEQFSMAFEEARFVRVEENLELIFVWQGSDLVNIYSLDLEAVDCFSCGKGRFEGLDRQEVEIRVESFIRNIYKEENEDV